MVVEVAGKVTVVVTLPLQALQIFAPQLAFWPTFGPSPRQVQAQGPVPAMALGPPDEQRLRFGSSGTAAALAVPHTPGPVDVFTATQFEVLPPLSQVHTHWPLPLSTTLVAKPPLHKFPLGMADEDVPFDEPQRLVVLCVTSGAEQLIAVPLLPVQL